MKKIIIMLIMVFLLVPGVLAVTKPVRGFVQFNEGGAAEGIEVMVKVKIHANLQEEFWCYCYADEFTTNEDGEFVQDLGNLKYLDDCPFWSKSAENDCSGDWIDSDLIYADLQGFAVGEGVIGEEPIHEFGVLDLGQTKEEFYATYSVEEEQPERKVDGAVLDAALKILDLKLDYLEEVEEFVLLVDLENTGNDAYEGLRFNIMVKDVSGQIIDSFYSEEFNLGVGERREIKIRYGVEKLEGVNVISALLYDMDSLLAVSEEVEVMIYEPGGGLPVIVVKQGASGENRWILWMLLIVIVLVLVVLFLEMAMMKRGKKSERKEG